MSQIKAELIDYMGDDLRVVNAARVSFAKESHFLCPVDNEHSLAVDALTGEAWCEDCDYNHPKWDVSYDDKRLIRYLARHGHWTPFSHPQITLRETVPIFVARQRFKHMVGFTYNEVSRRYVDDEPEFYMPDGWRVRPEGSVKQGSGTGKLPTPDFEEGFCINCGTRLSQPRRAQGGGQQRKYCSTECKTQFTNRNRNPYKSIFNNAKARAVRNGIEWELNFDEFVFPEFCPYLGMKLDYSIGKGTIQPNSPSFDRKNPDLGYVKGNVEIISNRANSMKNDAKPEELVKMAEAILLRHRGYVPDYSHSYEGVCAKALQLYNDMIEAGYSPEQARMVLPQSMMTSYYVTGSLAAFARAYTQRIDPHAQHEIQLLAKQWDTIIRPLFPVSWSALTKPRN